MGTAEGFPETRLDEIHDELQTLARQLEADAARVLFHTPA
jgi:hypothetical protein